MEFIAEIGLNHNGNFGLLPELIRQAARSGADFAKFQLGWRYKRGEINAMSKEELTLIHKCCDSYSIEPLFSIFNFEAWDLLKSVSMPRVVKIASRTYANDKELVQKISNEVPRLFISTGMSDKEIIDFNEYPNADYLWCQSLYPLLKQDIEHFPKSFANEEFVGLSDHSVGVALSLLAVSRGASVIERHFTLDKSDTTIRDHALSSSPAEFEMLIKEAKELSQLAHL